VTDPQLTLFGNDSETSDATTGALRPRPCVCEHPLLFAAELGEGRCGLCGREPPGR
jgi:hypothetical protein